MSDQPPLVLPVAPPEKPKPGPGLGGAILWCLAFLAVQLGSALLVLAGVLCVQAFRSPDPGQFLIDQLTGLGAAAAATKPNEPPRPPVPVEIGQALAYGMLAAQIGSLLLILLVFPRRIGPDWKRQLGVRKPAGLHVLLAVLVVPGFMLLADSIQELFSLLTGIRQPPANEALNATFRTVPGVVTFLAVALGPGLVEELWCRGFIGRGLSARYGIKTGVFITSLLFGLLHMDPSQVFITGLMGAYLHFVYLATRSIWVPMLVHMSNNGLAVLIVLTPSLSAAAQRYKDDEKGMRAVMDIAALGLLIFVSVALWTSRAEVVRVKPQPGDEDWRPDGWEPEYPGVSAPPPGVPAKIAHATVSPAAVVLALASFAALAYLLAQL